MKRFILLLLLLPLVLSADGDEKQFYSIDQDPIILQAKIKYYEGDFVEAYAIFSKYLFHHSLARNPPDYLVAFIGKTACEQKLKNNVIFQHNYEFIMNKIYVEYHHAIESYYPRVLEDDLLTELNKSKPNIKERL